VYDSVRAAFRSMWSDENERVKQGVDVQNDQIAHIASPDVVIDEDNQ